MKFNITS